jgi:nicotinate-nucleotide adenylyltransferase
MNETKSERMKQRVALYGGAFNPPHLAHLFAVQYLLTCSHVDQVWVMPSAQHAFGKNMAPFELRYLMLQRTLKDLSHVHISRFEYEVNTLSGKTYDTLHALDHHYPHYEFSLVIGADNLTESYRWYRFEEIVNRWSLIVLGRPGHAEALQEIVQEGIHHVGPTLPSISSSQIRYALAKISQINELNTLSTDDQEVLRWLPQPCLDLAFEYYTSSSTRDKSIQSTSSEVPPQYVIQNTHTLLIDEIWIWGQGRLAQTLQKGLQKVGYIVQTQSLRALSWFNQASPQESLHQKNDRLDQLLFPKQADQASLWILACRDTQIKECIDILTYHLQKKRKLNPSVTSKTQCIFHCSGTLGYKILTPLQNLGLSIAQCHPLQSLRGTQSVSDLQGAAFYVAGNDLAVCYANRCVQDLKAWVLSLPTVTASEKQQETQQALYHAAAVCAGNIPLLWVELACQILTHLGINKVQALQALIPLAEASTRHLKLVKDALVDSYEDKRDKQADKNSTISLYAQDILQVDAILSGITGPLVRHDISTLQSHLMALAAWNLPTDVQNSYQAFTLLGARLCSWSTHSIEELRESYDLIKTNQSH